MNRFLNRLTKKQYLLFSVILVLLIVFLFIFFKTGFFNSNTNLSGENEAKILAKQVGKLMYLPLDETPTIATVSDPTLLKNQTFFLDAKVGDKVLIYTLAKKAILYDPVANKIITIAPLSVGGSTVKQEPFTNNF